MSSAKVCEGVKLGWMRSHGLHEVGLGQMKSYEFTTCHMRSQGFIKGHIRSPEVT